MRSIIAMITVGLVLAFGARWALSQSLVSTTNKNPPAWFETIYKSSETYSVKVTVSVPRKSNLREPIFADITLSNGRSEIVFFDHDTDERDFCLGIFDLNGRPIPFTPVGKDLFGGSPYEFNNNLGLKLTPGSSIKRRYDLRSYFSFPGVGRYRLSIVKTVAGTASLLSAGKDLEIDIDSVVFGIE